MTRLRGNGATERVLATIVSLVLVAAALAGLFHHHGIPDRPVAGGSLKAPSDAAHPASSGPCLLCRTTHDQILEVGTPPILGDIAAPRAGVVPDAAPIPSAARVLVRSPRAPPVVVL
jgi:hypothetical protein